MNRVFSRLRLLCSLACAFALAVPLVAHPLAAQSLSPTGPANFGSINVGSTANATFTFSTPSATNIASVLAVTDGVANRDFTVSQQNCVGTVTSCSIQVSFAPYFAGPRHGYLAVVNTAGTLVGHAYLYGIGVNGQVSYSPSVSTATASVASLSPAAFSPTSAIPDGAGNIYLNDIANSRLLQRTTAGVYSSVTSLTGSARSSLALSGDGTVFASSPTQGVVYAIPAGHSAVAISTSVPLVTPTGLATDGLGYLYIADAGANHIVRVALDSSSSTVLTLTGIALSSPGGLAVDASNNLYIVDSGNDRIVELNLNSSAVSVVTVTGLSLNNPSGIAVDPAGTLYIADTGNQRIVLVPPGGGAAYVLPLTGLTLAVPTGIAVGLNGDMGISDTTLGLIGVARSLLTVTFPTATKIGTVDTTDGFESFTVQNTGNIVLALTPQSTGSNPAISSTNFTDAGGTSTCPIVTSTPSSTHIALGASCTYTVEFTPVGIGTDTSTFTMYVNDAGASGVTDAPFVTLTGTGTSSLAKFTIIATPSSVLIGAPESFTVTVLNSSGQTATDFLGTVTFTSTDTTAVFLGSTTYTFTAADAGVHTFTGASAVDFHQAGSFTLSVTSNGFTAVSNAVQVQVPTTTLLTANPNPVGVGNNVTLIATVTASAGGPAPPAGTVTFYSTPTPGATAVSLGTATLNASGVATLATSFNTGGNPCITATYAGNTTYLTSTSPSACETVGDFSLTLDSNSSANATVLYSQPVSYTFDVAPVDSPTIVGTINFSVTGLNTYAPFTLTPTTINAGAGASTIKLTITPINPAAHRTIALNRIAPLTLALLALPFVWIRRRKLSSLLAVFVLTALLISSAGCSNNSGYFNPAFTLYKITVTGTSGSVTHSSTVTLTAE